MSNLIKHAERELQHWTNSDDIMSQSMARDVLALVAQFAEQGHSGFSAGICLQAFTRLADFKPLRPLTGEPDEWVEVGDGVFQNKRCSSVFKERDGAAYNIDGVVFEEPSGSRFTSRGSRTPVVFPYAVPARPEVVKVDAEGAPLQ